MMQETQDNWLLSLSVEQRYRALSEMRRIDTESEKLERESQGLAPCYGEIAVGAGAFDPFVRSYGLESFLSEIRRGRSPSEAKEQAQKAMREAVAKHNVKRPKDMHWQRHEDTGQDWLSDQINRFVQAVQG